MIPVEQILEGIAMALTWKGVAMIALGVFAGITVGAIPGINGVMATAILVPFSFFMAPVLGIPFLLGIHKGATFGGAIPAILVNTPGTASAAATTLDGYPLAQKGEARSAIQMALYASFIGDTFSDICLVLIALPLAMIALMFGPAEYFALLVMGLTIISTVTGNSMVKGVISALLGVMFGLVGLDAVTGAERFTLDSAFLETGFSLVPVLIGIFAVSEVFIQAENPAAEMSRPPEGAHLKGGRSLTWAELRASFKTIVRSSLIGTLVGAIPATGASIAAWIGYGAAKQASPHPEKFGTGIHEGVAAAEAANSAVAGADLIPTLTLGIPGSGTTAILMGAFIAQGLRPGPLLFQEHGSTVYAIFTLLLLGNPITLLFGSCLTGVFARFVTIRRSILFPSVLLLSTMGVYMNQNDLGQVLVAVLFGLLGYIMRKMDYAIAPLVIAFIITPTAERSLKQALIIADGELSVFVTRPISALFLLLSVGVCVSTIWRRRKAAA